MCNVRGITPFHVYTHSFNIYIKVSVFCQLQIYVLTFEKQVHIMRDRKNKRADEKSKLRKPTERDMSAEIIPGGNSPKPPRSGPNPVR